MRNSRRANAVFFGFDFQVNAAIVLMIENMNELESVRLEGDYEDIQIKLKDNQYILAQAKAVVKGSYDFSHVRENLKKSLISLSEGCSKVKAKQTILITNSSNPLNDEVSKPAFYGHTHRNFIDLPPSSQDLIRSYLAQVEYPLDLNSFMIQTIPFETDDEKERYKVIKSVVDDFIGDLGLNIAGLGKRLMHVWQSDVFQNSSKSDASLVLSKKGLMWPIVVIATDVDVCIDELTDNDEALYQEVIQQYMKIINSCCERFSFATQVLSDFHQFCAHTISGDRISNFVNEYWEKYLEILEIMDGNHEVQSIISQVILHKIIKDRFTIKKIKEGVNL